VMARQLGMRFSRFEASTVAIKRGQVDMRVDTAAFREWICHCLNPLKQAASSPDETTSAVDIAT